jgi:hypothetical protein
MTLADLRFYHRATRELIVFVRAAPGISATIHQITPA